MTNRQKIMSDLEGLTYDDWHMFHCDSDVQGIAIDALELLKSQPEQRHGHWNGFTCSRFCGVEYGEPVFRDGRFYICSICRRKSVIKEHYCQSCGATMDEEVKQDG